MLIPAEADAASCHLTLALWHTNGFTHMGLILHNYSFTYLWTDYGPVCNDALQECAVSTISAITKLVLISNEPNQRF